jgi:integrase
MHPERLVRLMGHSTKKMVYETYGKYVEGLESDGELIRGYFGNDFK